MVQAGLELEGTPASVSLVSIYKQAQPHLAPIFIPPLFPSAPTEVKVFIFNFNFCFNVLFCFRDRVLLCRLGRPGIYYID